MTRALRWLASYFLAHWHLRRAPLAEQDRLERARWCRDNCGTFAGRWFGLGAALWLIFMTPFVQSPVLAITGLVALTFGIWHMTWQIIAQSRAGPPYIEPPAEFPRGDDEDQGNR